MARGRHQSDHQKRQRRALDDKGSRLQGVKREQFQTACRKSARLAQKRRLQEQACYKNTNSKRQNPFFSTKSTFSHSRHQSRGQKRKRQEAENRLYIQGTPPEKRPRISLASCSTLDTLEEEAADREREGRVNRIDYWIETGSWPKEYFEQESCMSYPLARKKSSSSIRRRKSVSDSATPSSTTPSDQKPREEKSAPYRDPRYETILDTKRSFMDKDKEGVKQESKDLCRTLLGTTQEAPDLSLFSDKLFESTCRKIRNRNEARVIQDIARLIVPSAETLATYGAEHLEDLVESVDEGWNSSIPLIGARPQPDYSVGFRREAFTKEQLDKLQPFVGDIMDNYTSFFMGTYYMYFPFLTCEVKCGAQALDIADRQNAHSMTLAARGIVELFRVVNREKELDREILAFSMSHDHRSVRIYGHYPVIKRKDTTYYRHPIHTFDFTA